MKRTAGILTVAFAIVAAGPTDSAAANKEQQQLMAELRMLQEQQQQLQQILGSLGDALKTLTTRLDEQGNVTRKAFADQRLLVEGVGETVRILRERTDDTNVRLSTMTQELEAMRQTIAAQPVAAAPPPAGETSAAPGDPAVPPAPTAPMPLLAPTKIYDNAWADYTAGHYDLAVEGFETYIKAAPRSELADDAQLNIGHALYAAGKNKETVAALQQVINGYPQSDSVPAAWYKLGLTYERLKQEDLARKAYDTLIKNHDGTTEAKMAGQALERLNRK
jgi:tol-pal system protein YbgF